jgi:hypothetical protein
MKAFDRSPRILIPFRNIAEFQISYITIIYQHSLKQRINDLINIPTIDINVVTLNAQRWNGVVVGGKIMCAIQGCIKVEKLTGFDRQFFWELSSVIVTRKLPNCDVQQTKFSLNSGLSLATSG